MRAALVAACAAAALSTGCQRTEILIGVITDLRAPGIIDRVKLQAYRDGRKTPDQVPDLEFDWDIPGIPNQPYELPGSFGVYSPNGQPVKVETVVTGYLSSSSRVERRSITSLVPGKTLFLRMGLVAGCLDRKDCAQGETCIEGVCKDPFIDSRTLPEFNDELVTHVTCGAPGFINTATGNPVPTMGDMRCNGQCVEGTCYVPPPGVDAGTEPSADGSTPSRDFGPAFDLAPQSIWVAERFQTPTSGVIKSVWGVTSPGYDIFAVGDNGGIWHKSGKGAAWASETSPTTSVLYSVSGSSADDVWAVGDGVMLHRTGGQWSVFPQPGGPFTLRSVSVLSATEAYAVGNNATSGFPQILLWNGSGWNLEGFEAPSTIAMTAVSAYQTGQAYAVGNPGGLYHRVNNFWQAVTTTMDSFTGISWPAANTGGYIASQTLNREEQFLYPDGTIIPLGDGFGPLNAVFAIAPEQAWFVGDNGRIAHTWADLAGRQWETVEEKSGTTSSLRAVWAAAADDIYACGDDGTILRSTGAPTPAFPDAGVPPDLSPPVDLAPPADMSIVVDATPPID